MVLALVLILAGPRVSLAQTTEFTGIVDFGDSYADTGAAPGGAFRILGIPCPSSRPTCRFSGGTNFIDTLQSIYGLSSVTNYAVGTAPASNTTPEYFFAVSTLIREVADFDATGQTFGRNELVAVSIGINDQIYLPPSSTLAQFRRDATISARIAASAVGNLIQHGAHNIAWLSAGNLNGFPAAFPRRLFTPAQENIWADTHYRQLQQLLEPWAKAGTRIFLFDYATLLTRVGTDPGRYGFASAGSCWLEMGANDCINASPDVRNKYFFYDGVHPTSAGFALIARYMANQIDAPLTVAPEGHVALATAMSFSNRLMDRLELEGLVPQNRAGWSVFASAGYAGGRSAEQTYASSYDYSSIGGMAGLEYRYRRLLRTGLAFGYSRPRVDLAVQDGHYDINAYQAAGYASLVGKRWFADGLVAYGRQQFDMKRDGIVDTVHSSTHADTFTVAAKTGYLARVEELQFGPIADVTYVRAHIASYSEVGDNLLTNSVAAQSPETLTCEAGVQIRLPENVAGKTYSNFFLDLTAVRDVIGSGYGVVTTQSTTPLLPVITQVESRGRTYGKIQGGASASISSVLSVALDGSASFGRSDGNDFTFGGGIKLRL